MVLVWVGDVDLDLMTSEQRTMVLYLLRKIKDQQEEIEELKRHVRGQSRRVGKLTKMVKGDPDQLEIPMGGTVV